MSRTTYKSDNRIRTVVAVGVFCAFAFISCVLFHFKASFLTFDLKDAVMTIGAMLFGPLYGLAMTVIVALLEMLTVSTTGLYGLVMNIAASATFVCVGSAIYVHRRKMSGAVIGMASSVFAMTAVMMGANMIVTPYYTGMSASDVAAYIPTLLLPFNLTKAVFNASLVFILYKPVSKALSRAGFRSVSTSITEPVAEGTENGGKKKVITSVIVIAVAAVLAAASLVYFFVKLGGTFSFGQ
jgi:riboflavin transporter FmnP